MTDPQDQPSGAPVGSVRGVGDLVVGLWRAKWLMLLIFLPIFGLGLYLATLMPTTYAASSRLFVQLGEEYVFRPRVGSEAAGALPQLEELIQAELEILRSPVVAERALDHFPLARVYPELAGDLEEALAQTPPEQREAVVGEFFQKAVERAQIDFDATAAPRTPVIATRFESADAGVAAEMLNAMIGAYFAYRSEIFSDSTAESFAAQRVSFQDRLKDADAALQRFLAENEIGDFVAERETAANLYEAISQDLFEAETRLASARRELGAVRGQLGAVDAEVELFTEDASEETLLQLRLQREDLLSRYQPGSRTVQAIDRRIAQAEAFLANRDGPSGTVRRGPNPLHQDLQARASALAAQAASDAEQVEALRRQLAETSQRQRRIADLEPRWQALQRERALIEQNLRSFSERELEARTRQEISLQSANNIRVLEPARMPMQGSSLALPAAALGFLLGGLTALAAGLIYAVTRPGLSTARAVERASGLPVVSAIPKR